MAKYMITIFVFFLMSHLIFLIGGQPFLPTLAETFQQLQSPLSMTYVSRSGFIERPLFPYLFSLFSYSFSIFFLSFGLALLGTFILLNCYYYVSERWRRALRKGLTVIESIPDLMIIWTIQLVVVYIYQSTGIKWLSIADSGDGRPIMLPVFCLTVIPTIQLTKMAIHYLHDESGKTYIEFAYAKGIDHHLIFYKHLFRNIIPPLFYHSKSVFLFMLSSMLIIEYAFNINGYMSFLLRSIMTPATLFVWLSLLFTTFFLYFQVGSIWLKKRGVRI